MDLEYRPTNDFLLFFSFLYFYLNAFALGALVDMEPGLLVTNFSLQDSPI